MEETTVSELELFKAMANKEKVNTAKLSEVMEDDLGNTPDNDWLAGENENEEQSANEQPVLNEEFMNQLDEEEDEEEVPRSPPPTPEPKPSLDSLSVRSRPIPYDYNDFAQGGNSAQEKRLMLAEYKLLRTQHPEIVWHVELNEDNEFEEIQLTLLQARNAIEIKQGAEMLTDGLKILTTGIEWIAPRVTKDTIRLDGWSEEVANDVRTRRYDTVMCAIYRRYWRSYDIMNSPLSQLGLMLTTSAGIYCYKHRNGAVPVPGPSFSSPSNEIPPPHPAPPGPAFKTKMRGPSPPPSSSAPQPGMDASNLLNGLDFSQMAAMANLARAMN